MMTQRFFMWRRVKRECISHILGNVYDSVRLFALFLTNFRWHPCLFLLRGRAEAGGKVCLRPAAGIVACRGSRDCASSKYFSLRLRKF